jgi:hypothetical protein
MFINLNYNLMGTLFNDNYLDGYLLDFLNPRSMNSLVIISWGCHKLINSCNRYQALLKCLPNCSIENICEKGDLDLLLWFDFDIDMWNVEDAFIGACRGGCMDIVHYLIEIYDDEYNESLISKHGEKALQASMINGTLESFYYLVKNSSDVCSEDWVLKWAIKLGYFDIVRFLVDESTYVRGYGTWIMYFGKINDYHLQYTVDLKHLRMFHYLINCGISMTADPNDALVWGAKYGKFDIVQYVVEKGADTCAYTYSAIRKSARKGYCNIVKYLVEKDYNWDICVWALRLAAKGGHTDTVKYLADRISTDSLELRMTNHLDGNPFTMPKFQKVLIQNTENGNLEIVRILMELGCDAKL